MKYSISIFLHDEIKGEIFHTALKRLRGFERSAIVKNRHGGCNIVFAAKVMPNQLEDVMASSCNALMHLKELLGEKSVLRVGTFFEEAHAFMRISGEILSMLSKLPVDLEVSTYPVS